MAAIIMYALDPPTSPARDSRYWSLYYERTCVFSVLRINLCLW